MTTEDAIQEGLKEWIELRASQEYTDLFGVQVLTASDAEDFDGTVIIIKDTGSEEHPILRGVLEVGIEVALRSVPVPTLPEGEDYDEEQEELEGTTKEQHQTMASGLYNTLADVAAIQFLDTRPGLKCFDIRNVRPTSGATEDSRVTLFQMEVRACQL